MASQGILKIIESSEKTVAEMLNSEDFVVIGLFELRPDEIKHLLEYYTQRNYLVEFGKGFPAPGSQESHPYAIIRKAFF
ncbi:MAG TPA: hypothetical protein ENH99_01045 [Candidatus Pacearchaeota archaeon]|nr:hypothetical protein [Candidatus Pacearchaeota archaeon]